LGLFVLALLAIALWIALRRRARSSLRRAQTAALILAGALVMGRSVALAHEGHDIPPAAPGGSAGPRYVAKESQFLLAIRTLPLAIEQLRTQVTAVGHVVPGTGAWTTIAAPQSGRFESSRVWAVGDRVQRGQLLGYLQVIDRLPVRAPISGLVADVLATPGQWVQAGQPLVRVLDPAHLRVEVPLFGENLSRGLAAKNATVQLSAVPNRKFAAQVRGLAPTVSLQSPDETSPASGTSGASPIPPLLLDVTNTGGLLRPGMLVEVSLETAVSQAVLAVPQSAIVYQETGPGVFVHTAPELFELRPVAVGARYVDRIGITGDLKPGDRVVTQGAYSLIAAPPANAPAAGGQK
jgi:multidrug efflux pump subunit AcrA (membrane-fusion protein)